MRRLRRKHQQIELKELSNLVRQTKELAQVQKQVMMDNLRIAENDADNSNYEESRARVEAVRNAIHSKNGGAGSMANDSS